MNEFVGENGGTRADLHVAAYQKNRVSFVALFDKCIQKDTNIGGLFSVRR